MPGDQLALVHHNELIMPAAESGAFRNMLSTAAAQGNSGGGDVAIHPTTNVHIRANDGASMASWWRSKGSSMAKGLDEAVRHGAALGLKRLNGR